MATSKNPADAKAQILQWLQSIRARQSSYSFRLVQARLKTEGMPSAAGWTPLIAKYTELNHDDSVIDWDRYASTLGNLHKQAVMAGTTAVWLFDAPTQDVSDMLANMQLLEKRGSAFAATFPHPVASDVLLAQRFETEVVQAIDVGNGVVAAVACGKRAFRHREQIAAEHVGAQTREEFGDFQELIVVRAGFTQAFDRLVFRRDAGRFEIHLDLCCPLNTEELQKMHESYIKRIKPIMERALGRNLPWLYSPVNLFPFIESLYNLEDGRVLNLGHSTGTKSIKEERMRGQSLDLRREMFHQHGIRAIRGTDAFSIKKGWDSKVGRHTPSISIPGHFSKAGVAGAVVRHAIVENCASMEDFDMVLSKLA